MMFVKNDCGVAHKHFSRMTLQKAPRGQSHIFPMREPFLMAQCSPRSHWRSIQVHGYTQQVCRSVCVGERRTHRGHLSVLLFPGINPLGLQPFQHFMQRTELNTHTHTINLEKRKRPGDQTRSPRVMIEMISIYSVSGDVMLIISSSADRHYANLVFNAHFMSRLLL